MPKSKIPLCFHCRTPIHNKGTNTCPSCEKHLTECLHCRTPIHDKGTDACPSCEEHPFEAPPPEPEPVVTMIPEGELVDVNGAR